MTILIEKKKKSFSVPGMEPRGLCMQASALSLSYIVALEKSFEKI
jgi:hypothetical protein